MERDISVFSKLGPTWGYDIVIGTHPGIFHADEIVAISLLHIYHDTKNIGIMRSEDPNELKKCDIFVDIGDSKHINTKLIWKELGKKIVKKLANNVEGKLNEFQISAVADSIDENYIQSIDENNNRIYSTDDTFSYIEAFLPSWYCCDNRAFNEAFAKVVEITISILERFIRKKIEKEASYFLILSSMDNNCSRILELPAPTIQWQEPLLLYNGCFRQTADFVIFPYPSAYPSESWAAQCVPRNCIAPFDKRIPFPKNWAGQTNKLSEISGIPDATFCDSNCSFVRANTKEAVIQMCEKAIEIFESSKTFEKKQIEKISPVYDLQFAKQSWGIFI